MLRDPIHRHFSPELFWDTAPDQVDFARSRRWVVVRVLEYGRLGDWEALRRLYPMHEIVACAKRARSLDRKALAFIAFVSGEPRESFRCCTGKFSPPTR